MTPLRSLQANPRLVELVALLPLCPVLVYQISYMNSFYPITEGWFTAYGSLIRGGDVPYRDFLLPLPPFYPALIACIRSLFGESLVPLHWVGLVITGLIGLVLYALLRE